MALITNETLMAIRDALKLRNQHLQSFAEMYAANSWDRIQLDMRTLSAAAVAEKYPLGTELVCKYNYNGTEYDFPWIVMDNNRLCEWEDGSLHQGLWLGAKHATIESLQFDGAEQIVASETVAQEGIYYFYKPDANFAALNLSPGDAIPTDLGTIYRYWVNDGRFIRFGYNNYKKSSVRQWLNSDKERGSWWTPQHDYDGAPNEANTEDGFLYRLDPDFQAAVTPVKISAACNTWTDGGLTDILYDKFFLQSLEELYGEPQTRDVEGPYFPWWKEITGLDAPANGSGSKTNEARILRRLNALSSSGVSCWTRSCQRHSNNQWFIHSQGYLSNLYPTMSYPLLPACVIS